MNYNSHLGLVWLTVGISPSSSSCFPQHFHRTRSCPGYSHPCDDAGTGRLADRWGEQTPDRPWPLWRDLQMGRGQFKPRDNKYLHAHFWCGGAYAVHVHRAKWYNIIMLSGGRVSVPVVPSSAMMSMACRGLTQCTVGRSSVKAMVWPTRALRSYGGGGGYSNNIDNCNVHVVHYILVFLGELVPQYTTGQSGNATHDLDYQLDHQGSIDWTRWYPPQTESRSE